jgi:flagellar basal body rod protein FlgF
MAAAKKTVTYFNLVGEVTKVGIVAKATQHDWVVLDDVPGAIDVTARNLAGGLESHVYGKVQVNNGGTAYTATSTSIAYDNGAPASTGTGNYYAMTDEGEIVYVIKDSAPTADNGTLSVVRGCLGTTAKADGVADGDWLYLLNVFTLASSNTTPTIITYKGLPEDYGVPLFS